MKLPDGWFFDGDIRVYRDIYRAVPVGGKTAEIGVYRGRSICSVADIIKEQNIEVLAVDLFQPYLGDPATDRYERFLETAVQFGIINNLNVQEAHSLDAAEFVPDRSLDFVFIDGDHGYLSVKADIEKWAKKIRPGGFLGGHDYGTDGNYGVIEAVVERFGAQTRQHDSYIWLTQIKEVIEWHSGA